MDKDLEKKIKEAQKKLADIQRKQQDAEKEEADLSSKLKDPETPEILDTDPVIADPKVTKIKKPRTRKISKPAIEPESDEEIWGAEPIINEDTTKYDEALGNWLDKDNNKLKGKTSPDSSVIAVGATDSEPIPDEPIEPPPIPKILSAEEKVEAIAEKQITGDSLTKEELDFYFENRDKIYKAIDQKKYGVVADKLASYDTKNMSDEDVDFYKANSKEIEKLLTGEKMKEGEAIRKERERIERENMKKNVLDTLKKGKEFGISAINKTKTALEMFGRGGGALTGMSKDMEPEGIYPNEPEPLATSDIEPTPEPATSKTPEQNETEFELTRRLYFEYSTGSAKFKKESELFKQHAEEKEKAYKEAKMAKYQQLLDEGKDIEAGEFIAHEVELRHEHDIKHGPLWAKLKSGASQKIEAWDKWGVDKEGADWNEKLGNWNKRIFKRAVNIAFIGLTSSALVAGLASKGIGSATALSGGVLSRLGAKLGWGVTLGTFTEYLMTKIPPNADAKKSKKLLKGLMIGGGIIGAGTLVFFGPSLVGLGVGASAAVGYGVSRHIEKKGWTEKSIQQKKENAKSKFDVSNLDKLEIYEKEYAEMLKTSENSRIYRKLASTLAAVAGSTASLELIGYTKDHSEEMNKVYGNSFKNFWGGVKKWWTNLGSNEDGDSKAIKIDPSDTTPEEKINPAPRQKIETPVENQTEAPKNEETTTQPEHKDHGRNDQDGKHSHDRNDDHEKKSPRHHVGKKDYSGVHKNWMGKTGNNINNHQGHHIESNHGAKVGYTEVEAYRHNNPTGYKNYGTPYSEHQHPNHESMGAPERITTEEMADRIYSKNLSMILNTPESRAIWENIKDDSGETNVNTFLTISREDLGSVQIKNLQDYILKVIDEIKLKPQKDESIEGFLSRAFEKASHRPKMLEGLQL